MVKLTKMNILRQRFGKNGNLENALENQQQISKEDHVTLLNYYASLVANNPDTIIVFLPSGEIITHNKSNISSLFGITLQNIQDFKALFSNQTFNALKLAFELTLKGKSNRREIEFVTKENEIKHLILTFIPILSGEKDVEGIYLIIQDTTEKIRLEQSLAINQKHLNHAQQIAKIGSWEYLIEEDRLHCSDYFYDIFGFEKSEFDKMETPFGFVHPDDYESTYNLVREACKGISYANEFRIYHGETKELRFIKVQADVLWKDNHPYKVIGVIRDCTDQRMLEKALKEKNESYEYIFDNLSAGVWMRDNIDENIIYASKGLEDIIGIPLTQLYKNSDIWKERIQPAYQQELCENIKRLKNGESVQFFYCLDSVNGEKWIFEQNVPTLNDKGEITNIFGVVTDITDSMKIKEQFQNLANYDYLTGLPNQQKLYETLDTYCKQNEHFAVFYLDIDRFSVINDSLGYQIGNAALKRIADTFAAMIPKNGFIARLSSNEFIILVKNYTCKNELYTFAEQLIQKIQEPFIVEEYRIHISTSIGISFFPEDGDNKLTLLENAHSALYQAKQQGKKNYQIYSYSKDIPSLKKYMLDKDMYHAIEKNEFELYFQPKVEPSKGFLRGAEALIRWEHNEWGLISPGEFIPLAEENHLINSITDWVIQQVCFQLKEWRDNGYRIQPIAINVSPIRFMKKGLVNLVKEQLELYQIPGSYLEFEITESSLLRNDQHVLSTLEELKSLGVTIAVDDFGIGYSSLDAIRNFKPDTIKIDQVFIQNFHQNSEVEKAIISSTLHFGKSLNMEVIAEGVEEYEQLEFLKQQGCQTIQGYLFSPPVPKLKFEQILKLGHIKPEKKMVKKQITVEKRNFYRFEFPYPVTATMTIIEVNNRKVNIGSTEILLDNISLGGMKVMSSLKLPINSNLKFQFKFSLMNEAFEINGHLKWLEEDHGLFYYGIAFVLNRSIEDSLAPIVNKMSTLLKNNKKISDTNFITESATNYFNKT